MPGSDLVPARGMAAADSRLTGPTPRGAGPLAVRNDNGPAGGPITRGRSVAGP